MKRALVRYAAAKAKELNQPHLIVQTKALKEKESQLHRVRLERVRTSHLMPLEARNRLRVEMNEFVESIKLQKETLRRLEAYVGSRAAGPEGEHAVKARNER